MAIKVTCDGACAEPAFEPYSITLRVTELEDHYALKYLTMCNSKVPETLKKRAEEGYRGGKYQGRAEEIRIRTRNLLMAMVKKIPLRD